MATLDESTRQNDLTRYTRWNFPVLVAETAAFMGGLAWVDPATVLPLFITHLGGSPVLVGMVTVLQRIGYTLPQLPMAALLGHRPRRAPALRWGVLIGRLPMTAFVVYLWAAGVSNSASVIGFMLFAYFCVAAGNGVVAVPWQDIIAKSIPSPIRGRFFASMQFSLSLTVLGVGLAVKWVLGPQGPPFPLDYTILFTLMAAFMALSTTACWLLREPIRPVRSEPESLRDILRVTGPLLRGNRSFRYLVFVALFGFSLTFTTPFYMVYAKVAFDVPEAMAGVYILAMTLSGAAFGWVWGRFNDRFGPQSVVRGACAMLTTTPLLAISIPTLVGLFNPSLPYAFAIVFIAAGAAAAGMWMGLTNSVFEISSDEDRPRHIALIAFLSAPGALAPLIIGWLLLHLPFPLVFCLMALGGGIAAVTAFRMPNLPPRRP